MPTELEAYLARMRPLLETKYRIENQGHEPLCTQIATAIAEIFLEHGLVPSIVRFTGMPNEGGKPGHKLLRPIKYQGLVGWSNHVVCVYNGLAYDPILPKPIPIEQYAKQVFDEEVPMFEHESAEELKRYL